MGARLPFIKMQGIGNDFVVVEEEALRAAGALMTPDLARRLCDRRFGVGADQVLWVRPAREGAARMEIFNADGSTAEMCGNGIRAVALLVAARAGHDGSFGIETLAGPKQVEVKGRRVRVDMGVPTVAKAETLEAGGRALTFFEVGVGNPHAVIFVEGAHERVEDAPVEALGPLIERHARFPSRTNVEFVEVAEPSKLRVRVWERGAGLTLACGTGACASAVAAIASGRAKGPGPVTVVLPGGELAIEWAGAGQPVWMEGPAEEVFRGEFAL